MWIREKKPKGAHKIFFKSFPTLPHKNWDLGIRRKLVFLWSLISTETFSPTYILFRSCKQKVANFHKRVGNQSLHILIFYVSVLHHIFCSKYENHWTHLVQNLESDCLDDGPQCKVENNIHEKIWTSEKVIKQEIARQRIYNDMFSFFKYEPIM